MSEAKDITPATINGQDYWRVSLPSAMCAFVKYEEEAQSLKRICEAHEDLLAAVIAAKEMSDWFMKNSRQADHAHSELEQPLHETSGWKELIDAGYNGLMASYDGQFTEALAKAKGEAA